MTVQDLTYGTMAAGTTTITPVIPSVVTPLPGDMMILVVGSAHSAGTLPSAPSGWGLITQLSGGDAAAFGDTTGPRGISLFGRTYVSGDGNPTVTLSGGSQLMGYIQLFRRSESQWTTPGASGGDSNVTTGLSINFGSNLSIAGGDRVLYALATSDQVSTFTGVTFTANGVTFYTPYQNQWMNVGASGTDMSFLAYGSQAASGTSTGPATWAGTFDIATGKVGSMVRVGDFHAANISTALANFNGRHIDRCQNGNLWQLFWDGSSTTSTSMSLRYSTDEGATWIGAGVASFFGFSGTTSTALPRHSFFIDLDDYAHAVYRDRNDGGIYYRRGTPNAGRTAWTWSAATLIQAGSGTAYANPDIVAHREGTGWRAHIVYSYATSTGPTSNCYYARVDITSGGVISIGSAGAAIGAGYAINGVVDPSIDFKHTGDCKTVAGGTPNLYVAWGSNQTGAGNGIRYRKAVYSAGSYTWNAEREIDNTRDNWQAGTTYQCMYDGTRVVIAGQLADHAGTTWDLVLYERDEADTTTTVRVLASGLATAARYCDGGATFDSNGNVYFIGRRTDTGAIQRNTWSRSANTLGGNITTSGVAQAGTQIAVKRGYSASKINWIWPAGSGPYLITSANAAPNVAPNAPTITAPTGATVIDRALTQQFSWTFSDTDPGDHQSAYDIQYRVVGAGSWTTVSNTSTNQFHNFAGATFAAGDYEWQVRNYDSLGVVGPYSASSFFTAADKPATPTITAPPNAGTVPAAAQTVTWSAPNQTSYQVRTVADNAGSPDTATVYSDTAEVVDAAARSRSVTFPVNGRYEHVQVRVKYSGLWSDWASNRVLVSYTPPTVPTFTLTANNTAGTLAVAITNPAPGVGVPTTLYNDVYVNDGTGELRKASGVATNGTWTYYTPVSGFDYTTSNVRVVAIGDNGTTASS